MTDPHDDDAGADATEVSVAQLAKLALSAAALAERMAARPSVDGDVPAPRRQALSRLHRAVGLVQDEIAREAAVDSPDSSRKRKP